MSAFIHELHAALEKATADLNRELERRGVSGSASVEGEEDELRVRLSVLDRFAVVDCHAHSNGRAFRLSGALAADLRMPAEGFAQPMGSNGSGAAVFTAAELAQRIVRALAAKCILGR